jgi:hypothetical protein
VLVQCGEVSAHPIDLGVLLLHHDWWR